MTIITDESVLLEYIPNTMTTVEGEESLYDKLTPWIEIAELWLCQKILGRPTMDAIAQEEDSEELRLARRVVVNTAFKSAIPSLDVILTPNGFGIVSNQNVSPASKERVERLIKELESQRDHDLEELLDRLPSREDWHESRPYRFWSATLFPNITVSRRVYPRFDDNGGAYERFFKYQPEIVRIEDRMAEEFLSEELLDLFRYKLSTAPSEITKEEGNVIKKVKSEVLSILNGNAPCQRILYGIVDYIRKRPEAFPLWHTSDTAKLFAPPIFENRRENHGYFF